MEKTDVKPLYKLTKDEFIDRLGSLVPDAVTREKLYTDSDTLLEAATLIDELALALWNTIQVFPPTDLVGEVEDVCYNLQALSTYLFKSLQVIFECDE